MSQVRVQRLVVAGSNSGSFGSNVAAGNTILVFVHSPSVASTTCADGLSNTYDQVDAAADGSALTQVRVFRAYNINGGACTITVQNQTGVGFVAYEISGAERASDPVVDFDHIVGNLGGVTANSVLPIAGGLYACWSNKALNDNTGFVSPLTQRGATGSFADASSEVNVAGTYPIGMAGGTGTTTNVFMCVALKDRAVVANPQYAIRGGVRRR